MIFQKAVQFIYRKQKTFLNSVNSSCYHFFKTCHFPRELRMKAEVEALYKII